MTHVVGYSSQYSGRDAAYTTDGVAVMAVHPLRLAIWCPLHGQLAYSAQSGFDTHWWLTNGTSTGYITYQMPTYRGTTNYDLSGIYVWNYTEYTNTARGAKGVSILVADSLAHANGNQWTTVACPAAQRRQRA